MVDSRQLPRTLFEHIDRPNSVGNELGSCHRANLRSEELPPSTSAGAMKQLSDLHIEGFRSIRKADIPMRPLNVLIGANGAGKSNLIDF